MLVARLSSVIKYFNIIKSENSHYIIANDYHYHLVWW